MTDAHNVIEATLSDIERLRRGIAKGRSKQVSAASDIDLIRANAQSWFRTRRPALALSVGEKALEQLDTAFKAALIATNRATLRSRYTDLLKSIKQLLTSLQADKAIELSRGSVLATGTTSDAPPSFATIAGDADMQRLLTNRWEECVSCVVHRLPLAATVMMGGLLEALLVARINLLADPSPVYTARAAPKDKAGKTLKLRDWGLSDYIDVGHELKWISDTYKDVGAILRDYRNYIHPVKEYQHKKTISSEDAKLLWEIGKSMMRQLLIP